MKYSLPIAIGACLMGVALAQDVKKVEIEKISIPDKATHYYVMVKDAARGKAPNSGIKLEFSKAALTRVVSSKFDEKKAAVVIQVDEFYLEYREYELKEGSWNELVKQRVCNLNGILSSALKSVKIEGWGKVVVRYGDRRINLGAEEWELAVVNETIKQEPTDIVESFKMTDGKFVETSGVKNKFRGRTTE